MPERSKFVDKFLTPDGDAKPLGAIGISAAIMASAFGVGVAGYTFVGGIGEAAGQGLNNLGVGAADPELFREVGETLGGVLGGTAGIFLAFFIPMMIYSSRNRLAGE